jgi:hypothetical protein
LCGIIETVKGDTKYKEETKMTDYDVALTIYDKLPADIARVSLEDAQQILAGVGLSEDDDDLDDIDMDTVVEYVNKWLKEGEI